MKINLSVDSPNRALDAAISDFALIRNHIEETRSRKLSRLNSVVDELGKLQDAIQRNVETAIEKLTTFSASEDLLRLKQRAVEERDEFDAIDFIGRMHVGSGSEMWRSEEFHSNVIAWLLDTAQDHRMGSLFNQQFLARTGALPKDVADLTGLQVIREWENEVEGRQGFLDILLVDRDLKFVCAIENKVFSSEHSSQLTRYRKALEHAYPDFERHHIFLTPSGVKAYDKAERVHWNSISYNAVFETVRQVMSADDVAIRGDVRAFLNQYATTLRRNILHDTSVAALARKINLEHRHVLDVIKEHEPDWTAESKQMIKDAIAERPEWELDIESNNIVRFKSSQWSAHKAYRTGNGWAGTKSRFLFELMFYDRKIELQLVFGSTKQSQDSLRPALTDAILQNPSLFKNSSISTGSVWWVFYKRPGFILSDGDFGLGWDDGTTHAKIEAWVANFTENEFPAMNEVILKCLEDQSSRNGGVSAD